MIYSAKYFNYENHSFAIITALLNSVKVALALKGITTELQTNTLLSFCLFVQTPLL